MLVVVVVSGQMFECLSADNSQSIVRTVHDLNVFGLLMLIINMIFISQVRNSHGTGWGEDGYFRIERGTNSCGIEELMAVSSKI